MDPPAKLGNEHCCRLLFVVLFLQGAIITVSGSDEGMTSTSTLHSDELLKSLLNNSDPGVRPNVDGPQVMVQCSFHIISFGPLNEENMDYRLSIFLRQKWVDPRLTFGRVGDTDHVLVTAKDIGHIWKPDLFFPNEKSATLHQVTIPNKLMRIYHNGTVLYTTRITLTLACKMDLRRFPMDHQRCYVHIESYGYDKKHLLLDWDEVYGGVVHEEHMDLPQFRLSSKKMVKTLVIYPTGTFLRLTASFDLERLFGFFLLQTYLPTILIVLLAWISFWINMDYTPARVGIGIMAVLTMTAQLSGSKASIPKVNYAKAIDNWMAVCTVFVFVALIEYAFVNALLQAQVKEDKKRKDGNSCDAVKEKFVGSYVYEPQLKSAPMCSFSTGREIAIFIERVFRICFPVAFVVFNIVYWSVYLRPQEH